MKKQLSYIDSVHRSGTIWNISVMILLLAFPLTVAALFGFTLDLGEIGDKLLAVVNAVFALLVILGVVMMLCGGCLLFLAGPNRQNKELCETSR